MLAAKYRFVFYADIVRDVDFKESGKPDDLDAKCRGNQYFLSNVDENSTVLYRPTTDDGTQIGDLQTIIPANNANSVYGHTSIEQYDVYTCTDELDLRNETSKNFTLKRPFAKLRIITTDADSELLSGVKWNQTIVSLAGENLNNSFNALTEETTLNGRTYYTTAYKTRTAEIDSYGEDKNGEKTLCVFYIPVSDSKSCNLDFTVTAKSGSTTIADAVPYQVDNVPLSRNKVTTIKGKLLTKKVVNSITIVDGFDGFESPDEDYVIGKEAADQESLMASLTGASEEITYTGIVTNEDGLTLDFTNLTRSEPKYEAGNSSVLTLNIGSIDEGAVITILGGENAPKEIVLNTGAKCSVRANLTNTRVTLGGSAYKNLVYNCAMFPTKPTFPIDAIFVVDNDRANVPRPSNNSAMHKFYLGADFKVSVKGCNHDTDNEISSWFENNSDKSAWDYVGEVK